MEKGTKCLLPSSFTLFLFLHFLQLLTSAGLDSRRWVTAHSHSSHRPGLGAFGDAPHHCHPPPTSLCRQRISASPLWLFTFSPHSLWASFNPLPLRSVHPPGSLLRSPEMPTHRRCPLSFPLIIPFWVRGHTLAFTLDDSEMQAT